MQVYDITPIHSENKLDLDSYAHFCTYTYICFRYKACIVAKLLNK